MINKLLFYDASLRFSPSLTLPSTMPNELLRSLLYFYTAAYCAEKVNPLRESKAPAYSFGLKTGLLQMKSTTPSPNAYTLPSLIGSNTVSKRSNAAFSMTGRSKIGSFHEDLRKVRRPSNVVFQTHTSH